MISPTPSQGSKPPIRAVSRVSSFILHPSSFSLLRHTALIALALLFSTSTLRAQTSYPMLMGLKPLAVQIGATTECEVNARYNLFGAYQILVSGSGVTGEAVPSDAKPDEKTPDKKPDVPKVKLRFTVAADAVPGVRTFRVATPQGASTVGTLVVTRDKIIAEADNNDTQAAAQPVALPATLCGTFEKAEDVDYFKFNVPAAGGWTFHVWSSRCENQIHDLQEHSDPILTLRNAAGTVLAQNDNYYFADPLLYYQFTAVGDYFLEIRDVRYHGNGDWRYAIEAHQRPFATNVHPLAVAPGTAQRVELIGFNLPADPTALVSLPPEAPAGPTWINLPLPAEALSAAPVTISRLPLAIETEGENNTPAQAQPIAVPGGVSGRISADADVDCFTFDAKQGERFSFEVIARRQQSMLDPVVRILNAAGGAVAEADDLNTGRFIHADSQLENWAAPADGKFTVEVRDLHQRGGPAFVYFLQVTKSEPYFVLDMDSDKTLLAPGTGGAIFVRVYRKNGFEGDVQLAVDGLPPGVTASCGRILAGEKDGSIVLIAAADAPRGAANITVRGLATVPNIGPAANPAQPPKQLTAVAEPLQEIYMPGGGRYHFPADMHTVSVGDVMDLKAVRVSPNRLTLKPGQSQKLDITIERREGFKGNVTLDLLFQHLGSIYGNSLPPGVTIDEKQSQTLLTGDQSQGHITLTAANDAKPVENQQIAVMANVSINFVMKYTYAAEPVLVSVAAP